MQVRELPWIEPVTAMRCLAHRPHLTFLDSAGRHQSLGRYSYLTSDPFSTYIVADGQASCSQRRVLCCPHHDLAQPCSRRLDHRAVGHVEVTLCETYQWGIPH
jgi:para-aminobenzoate synthetase component 1